MIFVDSFIKKGGELINIKEIEEMADINELYYLEGAIVIKYYNKEIMGFKEWDLIVPLWSYFIDAIEEIIQGKDTAGFMFPDQPVELILNSKKNKDGLLITIGERTCLIEKSEFIKTLLSAGLDFFSYMEKYDASLINERIKIQKLKNNLSPY